MMSYYKKMCSQSLPGLETEQLGCLNRKNKIQIEPKTPLKSRLRSRRFRMNSDPGSGPMAVASSTTTTRKNQGAGKVATKF